MLTCISLQSVGHTSTMSSTAASTSHQFCGEHQGGAPCMSSAASGSRKLKTILHGTAARARAGKPAGACDPGGHDSTDALTGVQLHLVSLEASPGLHSPGATGSSAYASPLCCDMHGHPSVTQASPGTALTSAAYHIPAMPASHPLMTCSPGYFSQSVCTAKDSRRSFVWSRSQSHSCHACHACIDAWTSPGITWPCPSVKVMGSPLSKLLSKTVPSSKDPCTGIHFEPMYQQAAHCNTIITGTHCVVHRDRVS